MIIKRIPFKTQVKYKNALFVDGGVIVNKFHLEDGTPINFKFKIENPGIRAEFNEIKYFFHKVFGHKSFTISGMLVYENSIINGVENVSSVEIESINESIIQKVKTLQIEDIQKIMIVDDKRLFTIEEIIDVLKKEAEGGKVLLESDKELVDILNKNHALKNKKQLEYLSGVLQDNKTQIRFTLHPKFGFLFTFYRDNRVFYCWELLDSFATYLWSHNRDLSKDNDYSRIEKDINYIIENGRNKYKSAYKNKRIVTGLDFISINHTENNKEDNERFSIWKSKIQSHIDNYN